MFTHIDPATPDREFSFGIRSTPQNVWEGVRKFPCTCGSQQRHHSVMMPF